MTSIIVVQKTISAANGGFTGYNDRLVIPAASLNATYTGAGLISVKLQSFSTHNGTLDAIWIGHQGSGNTYNFDGNPVQLFFSGNASLTWSGASTHTTDTASFNYNPALPLIVSTHWSGTTDTGASVAGPTNCNQYFLGASQVSVTNPTGVWTKDSIWTWVAEIDLVETGTPTASVWADFSLEEDRPRARNYSTVLSKSDVAIRPLAPPPAFIGCELALANSVDTLGLSTHNPNDTLAAQCPPTGATPSICADLSLQEDNPRRRDYRVQLADKGPILPFAFRTAATLSIGFDLTQQDDRAPARGNYWPALASTTYPVEVLNYQMAKTPSAEFDLSLQEDLPHRPDYFRALESTAHPVIPEQLPIPASFVGPSQPRYVSYRAAILSPSTVGPLFNPPAAAVIPPLPSVIEEDLPHRANYQPALASTTSPVIALNYQMAATPAITMDLSIEEDLPHRRDYRSTLASIQPTPAFAPIPGCELGIVGNDTLGIIPGTDDLGIPCEPRPSTPTVMSNLVVNEQQPRPVIINFRPVLESTTHPIPPLRPVPAPPTHPLTNLKIEEDLPHRKSYVAALSTTSPVKPVGSPIVFTGCELAIHNGVDTLGLATSGNTLAANCPVPTPTVMGNLVIMEDLPRRKNYTRALTPISAAWQPALPFPAFFTPSIMANLVRYEDLPRRRDYTRALMSTNPVWVRFLPGLVTPSIVFDTPNPYVPPRRSYWALVDGYARDPQFIGPFIPPIIPPVPSVCVVSFGDDQQTATVTFSPIGAVTAVTFGGMASSPIVTLTGSTSQTVTLTPAAAGIVQFAANYGCPGPGSSNIPPLNPLGTVIGGDTLGLIDGVDTLATIN